MIYICHYVIFVNIIRIQWWSSLILPFGLWFVPAWLPRWRIWTRTPSCHMVTASLILSPTWWVLITWWNHKRPGNAWDSVVTVVLEVCSERLGKFVYRYFSVTLAANGYKMRIKTWKIWKGRVSWQWLTGEASLHYCFQHPTFRSLAISRSSKKCIGFWSLEVPPLDEFASVDAHDHL